MTYGVAITKLYFTIIVRGEGCWVKITNASLHNFHLETQCADSSTGRMHLPEFNINYAFLHLNASTTWLLLFVYMLHFGCIHLRSFHAAFGCHWWAGCTSLSYFLVRLEGICSHMPHCMDLAPVTTAPLWNQSARFQGTAQNCFFLGIWQRSELLVQLCGLIRYGHMDSGFLSFEFESPCSETASDLRFLLLCLSGGCHKFFVKFGISWFMMNHCCYGDCFNIQCCCFYILSCWS